MTEKECLNALNYLDDTAYIDFRRKSVQYKILKDLINEHFDNPPLKFEELKKGIWIWDNKNKCYFECEPAISTDMAQCVTYNAFWYNCGEDEDEFFEEYEEFEENRFYRKQVEDE